MAIRTEFRKCTCTHGLLELDSAQVVDPEDVFHCYLGASSEKRPILAKSVDKVSQNVVGALSKAPKGSEIRIGTPKLTSAVSQDTSVDELRERLSQQKKRIETQDKLINSLRRMVDTSCKEKSQQKGTFEREIDQLEEINFEQQKEIAQLKAVNSLQQKEISRLSTDNLLQREEFEKEIGRLQAENSRLKEKINQLRIEISKLEKAKAHQLTESAKASDRMTAMERQLVEHKEEIDRLRAEHKEEMDRRLAEVENRLRAEHKEEIDRLRAEHKEEIDRLRAEHKEEIDRLRAEHKEEIDRLRAEHKEEMGQRLAELEARLRSEYAKSTKAKEQEEADMHFGNLLLSSFDRYSNDVAGRKMSRVNGFVHVINQKINLREIHSTGGIFSLLSAYCDCEPGVEIGDIEIEKIERDLREVSADYAYFEAVCGVIPGYPLFSCLPGVGTKGKVLELCRLVEGCSGRRNVVAHKEDRAEARKAVGRLVENYGEKWQAFINGIVK